MCRACPRLVEWRERVAVEKRRSYADEPYWGRPAPGWGSERPRVMVVGLAPAAHGANRTGRVFTGDRVRRLPVRRAAPRRAGQLRRCASTPRMGWRSTTLGSSPPCGARRRTNAPTPAERATCAPWLDAEWRLVGADVRVVIALGGFAWRAVLDMVRAAGGSVGRPVPKFGHGATATLQTPHGDVTLMGVLPPEPAEHLHRQAHPGDARRRLRQAANSPASSDSAR